MDQEPLSTIKISKSAFYLAQNKDENYLEVDCKKAKYIQYALDNIMEHKPELNDFKPRVNMRLVIFPEKNAKLFSEKQKEAVKTITTTLSGQAQYLSDSILVTLDKGTNIAGALREFKKIPSLKVDRDTLCFLGTQTDIEFEEHNGLWLFTFKKFGWGPEKLWRVTYDPENLKVLEIQSPVKKNTDIIKTNDSDMDDSESDDSDDEEICNNLPVMLGNCVII
jgi:hypothetical protein